MVVHYRDVDLRSGKWTGVRVRQLCNLLKITQPELARLVRLPPHALVNYVKTERAPACVRLLLDMVESAAHNKFLGKAPLKPLMFSQII